MSTFQETKEELLTRHRKEQRDLVNATTSLKKQATKGEKKKKKEILKQIETMETELKQRHAAELKALNSSNDNNSTTSDKPSAAEDDDEESDDEFSPEKLLAQLELDKQRELEEEEKKQAAKAAAKAQQQNNSSDNQQPKTKRNRRKEKIAAREAANKKLSEEAQLEADQQPDLRKIELENMNSILKIRKLGVHEVPADGHCLFASVADQLKVRHNISKTVQELRSAAAEHIRKHPNDFSPFLFDENTMTIKEIEPYCEELENTAIWGGDLEITAFSQIFDCPITVIINGQSPFAANTEGKNPELKLAYYKHSFGLGEHYNSLRDA
jgi:OTU domain-containing protein 6